MAWISLKRKKCCYQCCQNAEDIKEGYMKILTFLPSAFISIYVRWAHAGPVPSAPIGSFEQKRGYMCTERRSVLFGPVDLLVLFRLLLPDPSGRNTAMRARNQDQCSSVQSTSRSRSIGFVWIHRAKMRPRTWNQGRCSLVRSTS